MKVSVYNIDKKEVGNLEVPQKLFDSKWNPELVAQAVEAQRANNRERIAYAKGRGEVRGGGKKPWKQKGTGRARHGSIRSPLWIGGGVTHGPTKEKRYDKKIPQKMKQGAIFSGLSKKYSENNVMVFDSLVINKPLKTKEARNMMVKILEPKESAIVILSSSQKSQQRAFRNIPKVNSLSPLSLNIYDILKSKKIIIEKEAVEEIIKHYKLSK
ncbi:MAG: 50S ribosomal protein L4 [Candidatus Paceibacterota bacterium]|jgi:large subunit ribosomal protein L4